LSVIATQGDVVEATRDMQTEAAGHGQIPS